jgi:peptidoglycan/LPS O-acetylase OafA/YrhL
MRPLNFRPIAFAGVLSYSLYLIQLIALGGLSENLVSHLPAAVLAVIALAIPLVLAEVVEEAVRQLRRRLPA